MPEQEVPESPPTEPAPAPEPPRPEEPAPSQSLPPSAPEQSPPTETAPLPSTPAPPAPTEAAPPATPEAPPSASVPEPAPNPQSPGDTRTGDAAPSAPESPASAPPPDPEEPPVLPQEPPEVLVNVVGSRPARAPGSVQVIGSRQLERFSYDDPNAVVQQVPGVYVRQEDGVGLRPNIGIRGVNPDRSKKLTLMEDGVLFGPAPYSAPAAYYFPLMARMAQVRVIKGPSAITYGPQTVGGAIDYISRPIPTEPTGTADVGVGQYGFVKTHAHFGASTDHFGFLIEGVRLRDGGFKHLPNDGDTGSTRNDWMVKARYEPDPFAVRRHTFQLKLGYADEVSNETYLGLTDEDFRRDSDQRYPASALDQMKNHRTSMVWTHQYDDEEQKLKVKTDVYRHDYARIWRKVNGFRGAALSSVLEDPENPTNAEFFAVVTGAADGATASDTLLIGPNDRTFVSQGVQSLVSFEPTTGPVQHGIEVGARLHGDSIIRRHSQTGYVMTDGDLVPEGTAEEVTTANTAETIALALHASDALTYHRFTLTPGIRTEVIWSKLEDRLAAQTSKRQVIAFMPGVGAYYAVTEALGVLAGTYRGFSPPAPGSDDYVEPEYSINTEAGLRYSDRPLRLELIGFFNDYQNLTDVCTFSSGCLDADLDRQFDAGEATIAGLEAHAAHEVPVGPLKLPIWLSYTFTRARFDTTFESQDPIYGSVREGDEIPYVPRHQFGGSVGLEHQLGGFVAGAYYVAPMREQAGSQPLAEVVATDKQFWMDAGAKVRPLDDLEIYLNVRNVLNARNIVSRRPYGARPNAPRWVQLGVRLHL